MKVDVTKPIMDLRGEPIKITTQPCEACGRNTETEDLTLQTILVNSLLNESKGESLSGRKKLGRFKLAMKIQGADEVDLKASEITKALKCVEKLYTVLIYGRVTEILEPETDN